MIVVVGLGNPLREDEGVALRILQELERLFGARPDVRLLDIGTAGMRLLDALSGAGRAIIVDCARMGEEPGTIMRFHPDEASSRRYGDSITPHAGDLLHLLDLSRRLGQCPNEIILFGIEPVSLGYREGLSRLVEERIPLYVHRVAQEIDRPAT